MTNVPATGTTATSCAQGCAFEAERERIHRQMLSSVSHDLKTPLASIIGSLEIYGRMNDKLSEEKKFV
jgi:two-component system sensor histidine kinase KdpD